MIIFLRPVTINDSKQIVKWRNAEKVMQHCFTKTPITVESNNKFFADNIVTGKYKQFIVERIEENSGVASYPIATVYLKDLDYDNKRCELCVMDYYNMQNVIADTAMRNAISGKKPDEDKK